MQFFQILVFRQINGVILVKIVLQDLYYLNLSVVIDVSKGRGFCI